MTARVRSAATPAAPAISPIVVPISISRTVGGWSTPLTVMRAVPRVSARPAERYQASPKRAISAAEASVSTFWTSVGRPRNPTAAGNGGFGWAIMPWTQSTDNPTAANQNTDYHQFTCSKCHTPHVSRLPRLMKTNCLDVGTSATNLTSVNKHGSTSTSYTGTGYTFGNQIADRVTNGQSNMPNERPMHCHNQKKENKTAGGGWNTITGWP